VKSSLAVKHSPVANANMLKLGSVSCSSLRGRALSLVSGLNARLMSGRFGNASDDVSRCQDARFGGLGEGAGR
jgi:hypothetical protein